MIIRNEPIALDIDYRASLSLIKITYQNKEIEYTEPSLRKFAINDTVLLYNRNRKAFMQMPYVIEEVKGEWYGMRGLLGLVWRKSNYMKGLS